MEFVLLHQQREMNSLKKQMDSQMSFLQARMDSHHDQAISNHNQVISMLERLTVKVAFASDVGKLFCDCCVGMGLMIKTAICEVLSAV